MNDEFETHQWPLHPQNSEDLKAENDLIKSDVSCMKSQTLADYIKENLKSADLKWSLFCAACNSYRFDSVLKPFPPFFMEQEDAKEIDRLRKVVELCPGMIILLRELTENAVPTALLDLLYWVLIQQSEPVFKGLKKEEHHDILSGLSTTMPITMPDHMFSVNYSLKHQQKFALAASNRSTKLAFHGSRLDNFYSIVNHGLQVSYNKIAAFGPGIYLSSEMGISLPYSPRGFTWDSSMFGSHISIMALCEIVDHPEVRSENDPKKSRTNLFDLCDTQSIPGKYFIVQNNDLVRIRYLLVYSSDKSEPPALLESHTLFSWIRRHKMFTFIVAYIILLLGIGSSNSSLFYKYYKRLLRRFNNSE